MVIMSTYEEFMVIIATAGLIISILNMKNKK
nr:MAG TPA: Putative Holin-like Toxin (Hol-Tox) [Caudoviricetes sp.]